MENIISRIIELNRQADHKIQEAKVQREEIISEANAEADKIRQNSRERLKEHISKVEIVERKAADKEIAEYQKNKEEKIKAYQELYDNNHEKWESEIFSEIVG